tara:strand:+ start:201 stop:446 length:246 start_codon:yes stop_codon:yes gene_type:complete
MKVKSSKTYTKNQEFFESDVLFQKLGNTWYAFSEIDDQIIYSALPKGMSPKTSKLELINVVEKHLKKVSKAYKKTNNEAIF